ncbi:MAG TPA: hypothetical protein VNU94_06435 [Acidobacteriaceae bacterium]|nr:hypothetical protein [Acidobacteriaceae bacterium]
MKWFAGAALAAAMIFGVSTPAQAQVGVYIGRTPPPLRYERRPDAPGPGYAWVDGYWGNQGGRYVWIGGRWQQPPYEGAYWNHPHYDHYQQGWQYHEGHWDHADADHHEDHHDDDHHDDRH